ncbi:hypothetical protein A167_03309 [Alcanivorax sp. S71-1-4]|uniref:DNA repair protein n=1 Tax=Alcanivorax sp. S71-1-4 TaxID=1177159 RepID=UPI00169C4EC6|nr:DNA repair protein [Alcanivorax sp. S71-1-4]KAF0806106.1 hypothetical protein A167_03309 [Alcanivorax sp. S71-1-4]
MITTSPRTTGLRALLCGLVMAGLVPAMSASANTLEERLRAELRSTAQSLQTLQSQQARTEAALRTAETERDAAQQEVTRLRAQLERASQSTESLRRNASAQLEARNDQLAQFRGAYDELLEIARTKEAQRMSLEAALGQRDGQLTLCMEKNDQLYDTGQRVLNAYEDISLGDVLRTRQPFAAAARVRFDEIAQRYGDELYQGRFDPQMQPPAVTADQASATALR